MHPEPLAADDPFLTGSKEAESTQPDHEASTMHHDDSQPELSVQYEDRQEGRRGKRQKDFSKLPELPIRRLSVQAMNALAEEQLLEEDWSRKPQQHLDFSDRNLFQLETIRPVDFCWGGLVKNKDGKEDPRRAAANGELVMPAFKVRTLNLDNNQLTNEDFEPWTNKASAKGLCGGVFRNLEVLRMKKNRLTYPMLIMPRLRELHLSYNEIVRIPPLAGLKQLEVLVLSHNKIDVIDEHHLKDTNNIRRLHLNDNKIKMDASHLHAVLETLRDNSRELENLQFQGNPFCSYLNEYQIFVVMFLDKLKRIDDIDLSKSKTLKNSMIEEARRAGMDGTPEEIKREFEKLDQQVKLRMKAEERKVRPQAILRPVLPKIDSLIEELDGALIDSSAIATSAALVYELASQIVKDGHYNSVCHHLFDVRQKKANDDPRAVKEAFAATFVSQVTLLAERSPDFRPLLLRTLAKFCPMQPNRFGELCLGALATLAKGGVERQREVLDVAKEMLIPYIAEKGFGNPSGDSSWETVVVGISKLCCPELAAIMADSVVPYLGTWYKSTVHASSGKLKSALILLLRCSVQVPDHATKVIGQGDAFLQDMMNSLRAHKWWGADMFSDFLGVCGIMVGCIKNCPEQVLPVLRKLKFPENLLTTIRSKLDASKGKDETDVEQLVLSKKLGASLSLLKLMLEDPAILKEVVSQDMEKKAMVVTLLMTPTKVSPDPLILASSLDCLHLLLSDKDSLPRYLDIVVKELLLEKNPNKVLPLITVKRFQELHALCEKHTALADDSVLLNLHDGSALTTATQLVDFTTATDPNAHQVIASIVRFISVFPAQSSVNPKCKSVSKKMNEQGRETILFRLLRTPSNDVRVAVLRFLEGATDDELESSEQKQLVDMLCPTNVGQDLPLLKSLMETLQRFICRDGETGDVFRSTYAGTVLRKAYQVLAANAERNTHGNHAEEEQKLSLSREAVALIAGASQQPFLRVVKHPHDPDEELLRCEEIASEFCRIIKLEETLHRPSMPDIPLELTWTGWHVRILLNLLNPSNREADALRSGRKQGFRVFAQIADVVVGSCHGFNADPNQPILSKQLPTSAQDRANAEAQMWNLTNMRFQVNRMDDNAYSDRYHQQDSFVSSHALEQMLHFLEVGIARNEFRLEARHKGYQSGSHYGHWEGLAKAIGTPHAEAGGRAGQQLVVQVMEEQKRARESFTQMVEHVRERKLEKEQRARESMQKEDPEVIPLPEVAKASALPGEALVRKFFIEDAWKHALQPDAVRLRGNVVPVVPRCLRARHEEHFMDENGNVGLQYYISAMLRAVYGIMATPMDSRFKEAMTRLLQGATMHSRLLALMEVGGSFVDCHVVAKFLRIMSMVLRLPPHEFRGIDHDSEGLHAEVLVGAKFACRCIYMVAPLLESVGREYVLTPEQQTLAQEAIRLLRAVCHFLMVVRLSDAREIQAECMEMAFDIALPMQAVRGIFMCLLYDVQAGIGTLHGPSISRYYVESILGRQEFHELCSEVLSMVVTSSGKTRYEVLELCNRFKVLKRQGLHTSFLKQLIDYTELHDFTLAMQRVLDEQPQVTEELATEFFMGDWDAKKNLGGESVGVSFKACTDFYITALGRPVNSITGTLKVGLWSALSKKEIASAVIGGSRVDDDRRHSRYVYQTLETPVRIEYGQEYRLVQESHQGADSTWHDGYINPLEAAALVSTSYASFLGGVSGQIGKYPKHFDGEFRRAGMLNFMIAQKEWIRHCLDVEILQCGGGSYGLAFSSTSTHQRMIVTNKRLLLMEVPRGGFSTSNLQSLAAGTSQQFWMSNLIRITCHTDQQMFILGFMVVSRLGTVVSEQLICVICHKSDVRQRILETLCELSGPSTQVRIRPTRDLLIHQAVARRTTSAVICMSYAFRGDMLYFYVLTNTEFCEFELHFESWVPSPKVQPYTGDEDILGGKDDAKLVRRLKEEQARGYLPASKFNPSFAEHLNARADALDHTMQIYGVDHEEITPGVTAADAEMQKKYEQDLQMFREAQQQTLRLLRKPPLTQLREVEFESGELPVLTLTFQKFAADMDVIKMRFMDDVARERWRRCLALALRGQSDAAEHWDRRWTGGGTM